MRGHLKSKRQRRDFSLSFSGEQSDQGYDSLSKEEERLCSRESDGTALVEDKGVKSSELWIAFCIFDTGGLFLQK